MPNLNTQPQRYALVTGAGSGLGHAFCQRLARDGWHVGVTDIDLDAAKATLATLIDAGGSGQVEQLDVTDIVSWQNLLGKLRRDWPRLDLLINNAGLCGAGAIGEAPLADFQAILEVNFNGTLNGCQAMVPWLKETAPGGHLVKHRFDLWTRRPAYDGCLQRLEGCGRGIVRNALRRVVAVGRRRNRCGPRFFLVAID